MYPRMSLSEFEICQWTPRIGQLPHSLSLMGQSGEVHAFEPVPQYFVFVRRLAELNPSYRVFANRMACGARSGSSTMAVVGPRAENFVNYDTNIGSSSLAAGFLDHARELTENITVKVTAFDDYVHEREIDLDRIGLTKIDVEGFEAAVLAKRVATSQRTVWNSPSGPLNAAQRLLVVYEAG